MNQAEAITQARLKLQELKRALKGPQVYVDAEGDLHDRAKLWRHSYDSDPYGECVRIRGALWYLDRSDRLEAEEKQERLQNAIAQLEASAKPKVSEKTPKKGSRSKAQVVAADVEKILGELHQISRLEPLEEDYERFRAANPRYLTFKAVGNSPQHRDTLVYLSERRGPLVGLAQELAGMLHKVKHETVKTYWKKRKR